MLDSSCQGVKRLFALAYDNTNAIPPSSHRRYFFPRIKIKNCNIETDGKNLTLKLMGKTFMINQLMT